MKSRGKSREVLMEDGSTADAVFLSELMFSFLHIPKMGGLAFREGLRAHFGSERESPGWVRKGRSRD